MDEGDEMTDEETIANAARYIWLRDIGDLYWTPLTSRGGTTSPKEIDRRIDLAIRSKDYERSGEEWTQKNKKES